MSKLDMLCCCWIDSNLYGDEFHDRRDVGEVGEVGLELFARSRSASLHCCEQYGPSGESRSQKRQKSWKQSMIADG